MSRANPQETLTPIYDSVARDLGYTHEDLRREPWDAEQANARFFRTNQRPMTLTDADGRVIPGKRLRSAAEERCARASSGSMAPPLAAVSTLPNNYLAPDGYRYGVMFNDGSVSEIWNGRTQRERATEEVARLAAEHSRDHITLARMRPGEAWARTDTDGGPWAGFSEEESETQE